MKLSKTKTPMLLNLFENIESIVSEFEIDDYERWAKDEDKLRKNTEVVEAFKKRYIILYADYEYENYSGDAYVLGFDKEKGTWFEVHGSHCSCYGLEGQWEPEYFNTLQDLKNVLAKRNWYAEKPYAYEARSNSLDLQKWLEL